MFSDHPITMYHIPNKKIKNNQLIHTNRINTLFNKLAEKKGVPLINHKFSGLKDLIKKQKDLSLPSVEKELDNSKLV